MTNTSERVVDNRYRVIKKVGQGNMGEVYQCQDTQLECVVAVKLLAGDAPEDDVVRFQREAKATAKLNHQNILKVRDFKRSNDGRLYLVMDFLEGESLADYIERNIQDKGRKDPEEILDILEQICSALEHSHESGILHRDVKPTNIILSKGTDGLDAKIIDFGIAKLRQIDHTLTKAGLSVGTPAYMSPEAVRGEELEERSDIYSFGVMMYELLSDKKPFSGENNLETMLMHLHKTAAPLKESGVGEQFGPYLLRLEQIVSRCLAKEKDSRFGSFAEVQAALEKCVPQSSANLTPVSTARGGRSMSVPLVSIGISVLVCILGLVLTKVMNNGQSAKPTSRPGEKSNVERVRELTRSSPTYRAAIDELGRQINKGSVEKRYDGERKPLMRGKAGLTTDKDVQEAVQKYKNEASWSLAKTPITGEGIKALQKTKATFLDLSMTLLTDNDLDAVAKISTLKSLKILNCDKLTDKGIGRLLPLRHLTEISVSGEHITAGVVDELVRFPQLDYVSLKNVDLSCADFLKFKALPKLSYLGLTSMTLPSGVDSAIDQLTACNVFLDRCVLRPNSTAALGKSKSAFQFVLQSCTMEGQDDQSTIDEIGIRVELTKEMCRELRKSSITNLTLIGYKIDGEDLRTLSSIPGLRFFSIAYSNLDKESALSELVRFKNLVELKLTGTVIRKPLTEDDLLGLRRSMKKCQILLSN